MQSPMSAATPTQAVQNTVFTMNEEMAKNAGVSDFVVNGGAYDCTILAAKYIKAGTGSDGIEFSVITEGDLKANFLNVYFIIRIIF